jgi:hypothetical protein
MVSEEGEGGRGREKGGRRRREEERGEAKEGE